jgi:hypothetical protein
MKPKLIICLALAIAFFCFYFGYQAGEHQKKTKEHEQFLIIMHEDMWQVAQKGDMKKIKEICQFLLWIETQNYEKQFGTVTGTNYFERHFSEAREITKDVESHFVSFGSVATNLGSNVTVTIEPSTSRSNKP